MKDIGNSRIVYLVFELTMPNKGSWNNKWSQENDAHYLIKRVDAKLYKERYTAFDDKDWYYRWDDGWTACVSCKVVTCKEIKPYKTKTGNFCGYDWMVDSIMQYGEIRHS